MQDRHIELLTAFIDGEVTRRERIVVLRLLNQSSEARKMLWQLQQNAQILMQLPAKSLPADFAAHIVDTLKKTAAAPKPAQPPVSAPLRIGPRVSAKIAWAAGLLLAVGGGIFYFLHRPEVPQIVDTTPSNKGGSKDSYNVPDVPHAVPNAAPQPIDIAFDDLKEQAQQDLLAGELRKGQAFRMDLYVKKNRQAEALASLGRELQFKSNLNKKNKDKELHIFAENLAPTYVAGFLSASAREDKGNFERIRVKPMSGEDRALVCNLLGIEPDELSHPEEKLPAIMPKSAKDANSKASQRQPDAPERRAVLLTGADSKQINSFRDQRVAFKANTAQMHMVQILFVLHPPGQSVTRVSTRGDVSFVSLP